MQEYTGKVWKTIWAFTVSIYHTGPFCPSISHGKNDRPVSTANRKLNRLKLKTEHPGTAN